MTITQHPNLKVIDRGADGEELRGVIMDHARTIADHSKPESQLVGFFMIGFFSDGTYSNGFRYHPDKSPIPARLMPAYIEEIVREVMITNPVAAETACDIFNQGTIG